MGALRRPPQGFQEAQPSHAMASEDPKTNEIRGSRRIASRMRYEAAMQELAAESQRLTSADAE